MSRVMNAIGLALQELRRNLVRSALTSLGILIGVAAVIAMVGIGRGASASIEGDLASMGSNLILVTAGADRGPQSRTTASPFDMTDVARIRREVPYLAGVAPTVGASVTAAYGGATFDTTVTGSNNDYLRASGWTLADGRVFTDGEVLSGAGVCVLGATVREALFGEGTPIGASMRIGAASCTVVGLLEAKGDNTMGMDQDDLILAPIPLVQRRLAGTTDVSTIFVAVDAPEHIDAALLGLDATLRSIRHVSSDEAVDFTLRDTREMASMLTGITTVLTGFLAAVAAVSLVVGGIGIMNVMLVAVTERTREIGIRMSIGALEGDVMLQFLTEATVLAALGGAGGAALGVAITALGSLALGVPFVVEPYVVLGSVVFSGLMGMFFGWMPARRAARLEPIDALRS